MDQSGIVLRHRQQKDGRQQEEEKIAANEKHYAAKFYRTKPMQRRLFRFFSILGVCLSTFTVVLLLLTSKEGGLQWSQIKYHFPYFLTEDTVVSRRFPRYGSHEVARRCSWTMQPLALEQKCTILARPMPRDKEGMSQWVSDVVKAHLQARLLGCKLLIDYGPSVQLHEVLTPAPDLPGGTASDHLNWTVPSGFECLWQPPEKRCIEYPASSVETILNISLPRIPTYRFAFGYGTTGKHLLKRSNYEELERALPSFQLETGMACALGSLFHLSPRASQFEPELFTRILPAIRDERALTIALYVRTAITDGLGRKANSRPGDPQPDAPKHIISNDTVRCALKHEQINLEEKANAGQPYSRVIWMVLTDSEGVKRWITETYSQQDVHYNRSYNRTEGEGDKVVPQVVQRKVLTTTSRGVHTRAVKKPATADFAGAMIDWYLIGESDLVIANGPSFGATAALRTGRPFRVLNSCKAKKVVHEL